MNPIIYTAICEFFRADPEPPPPGKTNMARLLAQHLGAALDEANTIRTVDALIALPLKTRADEHGVLIQDPHDDVYERNFDGTWCIIDRPDAGRSWCDRGVPSDDIELPVIVLRGL